jgi:hypothetical protein
VNNVQVLMMITTAMILVALGCLAFMRKESTGGLKFSGLLWAAFFGTGGIAGLYILLTGAIS